MKKIAVFLGSKHPADQCFAEKAVHLANELCAREYALIYGGASCGLMGVIADAALSNHGKVIGVLPEDILTGEIAHTNLTALHRVKSMQERKTVLAELSDAFIIFPGGVGTLEEFFEMWSARKIGLHQKPIGILNINGYYDFFIAFLQTTVAQGFLNQSDLDYIYIDDCPSALLDRMAHSISHYSPEVAI